MKPVFVTHGQIYENDFQIMKRVVKNELHEGYHYHDFYEFQFYYSENKKQTLGHIRINDQEYDVKSGDAVLINIFEPQECVMTYVDYERYCFSITSPLMLYICSEKSNLLSLYSHDNPHYPLKHLTDREQAQLISLYDNFIETLKSFDHGKSFLEYSLLFSTLAIIYNAYYSNGVTVSTTEETHIAALNKLVRYIDEHLGDDLNLQTLSEVTNFSSYYLCHLFKNYTNTTLNKYIISKRISNAKIMLSNSRMSVGEISESLGFNNYNHFFRSFKKIVGIGPAEYRDGLVKI